MRTSSYRKIYDTLDLIINLEFLKVPSTKVLLSRIIIVLPLLLISNSIFGQLSYSTEWFSDSEGLPQNSIKDIFPDKYNFIWLSTENGLVRYDGQNFKLFNDVNIEGLKSNRMKFFEGAMEKDSLFSVNNRGDVILIHNRRATIINDQSRNFQPLFYKLKNYWNAPPQSLYVKKDNFLRYVLSDESFYLIGNDSIRKYNRDGNITSTLPKKISDSIQFFVHRDKLYNMNKEGEMKILENGVFLPIDLDLGIKSYAKAFNNQITGQVFLYTDKQLFLLSFKGKKASTKLILENFDFDTKQIYSIYFDQKNDILYLGSITKGLCIIKKQYFENIPTSTRDKNFVEYSLNKLNDSTILTSTGIKIQNRKFLGHNNAIFENSTRNIAQVDTDGNFWVSKGRTLNKFYASTAYTSHDSIVFSEKVRAALITGNQFFIGTGPERNYNRKGALFSLNPNNPVDVAPKLLSNTSSAISALEKFNDSILLVGTHDGLFTYNSNTLNLVEVEGMEERQIRSIYKSGNEFWITTYSHGFFLYKDSKIRSVPLDLKKHLSTAHCIVEDDKGYFWITTNKGIFQVLKKDLTNYINKKSERIYYHYYDKSAGFSNNEFNGSGCPCGVKLLNHDIIFPSLEGLVTFNSYDINPIIPDNDIYIDEVVVDGRHRFVGDTLTLQKTDRITFQITSPFYGNPYNNQIEVQMDDGIWEPIGTSRTQSYTNLAPGKHSIKARKLAGFNSDYRYTSLNIYVTPTFWQSTLFKVLSIVLLLFLIYLIIGLRTRYITKKNIQLEKKIHEHTLQLQQTVIILREAKEKLRNQVSQQKKLVTAITHDVKTPLRFMALTSKLSFESFEHRSPEELRESTKAMFTSSYQLYHFIENVLDYSFISLDNEKLDNSGFTLSDLIQEKINFFGHISNSRKIKVSNRIPNGLTLPYNQQLFSIIIHNLLDNSIKHTYDGEIFFWHKQDGERFILNVQDTGSGMTTETLIQLNAQKKSITNGTNDHRDKQKGFGMTIVMELLLMLEGDIIIESQLRKGTKISMLFKTGL